MKVELSGRPLVDRDRDAELFVGRRTELAQLRRMIAGQEAAVVHAISGMGRTSTLRQLQRALRLAGKPVSWVSAATLRKPAPPPVAAQSDATAYQRARTRDLVGLLAAIAGAGGLDRPSAEEIPEERLRALANLPAGSVAIIDDVDPVVGNMLFGAWRDLVWQLDLSWVVSIRTEDLPDLRRGPAAAFFASPVELGPLSSEEAATMLRRRGVRDEDVVAAAVRNAQPPTPRAVLGLARSILTEGEAGHADFFRFRDEALGRVGRPAAMLWAELSPTEWRSASDETLQERMGWSRGRLSQVFAELREAGLVAVAEERTRGRPRKVYRQQDATTWLGDGDHGAAAGS